MEDLDDNLPTEGKRYYMSHSEFFYTESEKERLRKITGFELELHKPMHLSQLVCASNLENARKAVKKQLEANDKYIVVKCRIDYLIVGD